MNGAIPPVPNTPSWGGAQLKHRDNFTSYLIIYSIQFTEIYPWMPYPFYFSDAVRNSPH
jgi:hypothetical protein